MSVGSTPRSVWLACGGLALISVIAACLNWREAFFVARFRESLVSPVEHPGVYAFHGAVWYVVAGANVLYLAWRSERRRTGLVIVSSTLLGSVVIALLLAYAG